MTEIDFTPFIKEQQRRNAASIGARIGSDPTDPDAVVKRREAAAELGVPEFRVPMDPKVYERELADRRRAAALERSPALAAWLADDPDAALAKDDFDSLGWIGRQFAKVGETAIAIDEANPLGAAERGVERGVLGVKAAIPAMTTFSASKILEDVGKTEAEIFDRIMPPEVRETLPPSMVVDARQIARMRFERAQEYRGREAEVLQAGSERFARARQLAAEAEDLPLSEGAQAFQEALFPEGFEGGPIEQLTLFGEAVQSNPVGAAAFLAEVAAEFLPALVVSSGVTAATRSPAAGAITMGGASGLIEMSASAMDFIREQGVDVSTPEAAAAALQDEALMAAARERGLARALPIAVMDALSGGIASRALARTPIADVLLQGGVQAALGGGGEALAQMNAGQTLDLREVLIEGLAELVTLPVEMGGVGGRALLRQAGEAQGAESTKARLQQVDEAAAASKLAKRSPEAFARFLERTGMGDALLYVPAEALTTYFQASDMSPQDWGIDGDVLAEAALAGGDVTIPASVYASKITGTPAAEWVQDNATFDPNKMSAAQAESFNAAVQEIMADARAERDLMEAEDRRETRRSDLQVFDDVFGQLRAAGRSPDVAEREAAVWSAFFRTMAERYGGDARDMYESYRVRFQGPEQEPPRRRTLADADLNALRMGARDEPGGVRLADFVRQSGGIQDVGGDVATLEPPAGVIAQTAEEARERAALPVLPGVTPAARPGMGLDEMARAAIAAGYPLQGEDANSLIEALRDDLGEAPIYPEGQEPGTYYADLRANLDEMGLDVSTMTNDEIMAAIEAGGRTFEQAPAVGSEAFDAWAGEGYEMLDPEEVNEAAFSGPGPFVMRVYHGTTHEFEAFDASVRGNREGQFGAVNYFSTSRADASGNYGADGPDLTQRIDLEAERLAQSVEDDPGAVGLPEDADMDAIEAWSRQEAERRLRGAESRTLEVFVRSERPFVVGADDTPFAEFVDFDAVERQALERVAEDAGLTVEEVDASRDDFEDEIDEARYAIMNEAENPLIAAVQEVAGRYEHDASDLIGELWDHGVSDGIRHSDLEALMRASESLLYAEDPEDGTLVSSQMIAEIIEELGFDAIVLKNADSRFPNMEIEPGAAHIHVFDRHRTNIKSVENRGTFDRSDPRILFQTAPATGSEAFRRWFGDSKVVDENGEPLVVYHGTRRDFEAFDANEVGSNFAADEVGFFFLNSRRQASEYAESDTTGMPAEGGNVIPAYVSLQSPLIVDDAFLEAEGMGSFDRMREDVVSFWDAYQGLILEWAEARSADGVILRDSSIQVDGEPSTMVVAFRPEQIKSVHNRGAFDPDDPRILYQSEDGAVPLGALADEGSDAAVFFEALVDRAGVLPHQLPNVLEGVALGAERDGSFDIPSLLSVMNAVQAAVAEDPQVLDAVVSLVPVDVVNNLFGSEGAAKVALHDQAVLQNSPAFNADLPVAGAADAASSVGLLVREAAGAAAEVARVSLRARREAAERRPALLAGQGQTLRQGEPRAQIVLPAGGIGRGDTIISLFEKADLSSLLHESGHFFLEAFADMASRDDAPDAMREDLATIYGWLGLEPGAEFSVEAQEKWARGFEAYALEGKAPSLELADAFARFKAWLTRIYRTVRGLNVRLTPEVREVMDRMLATEDEIAAVRSAEEMSPLFTSERAAGMEAASWRAYQRMARRATEQAEQTLLERAMAKVRRERERWFREERKAVKAEVSASMAKERPYRLIDLMANGVWTGRDGAEVPDMRLSKRELVDSYGPGIIEEINRQRLGGKRAIYAEDGIPLREAAELFGFETVDEMVQTLQNTRKFADAVDAEVERILTERHGDPLSDGSIEEEALAALHSEQRANLVASEARQLAKRAGRPGVNITAKVFRQRARMMLGRLSVREAIRPASFLQAERRARKGAEQAFARVVRAEMATDPQERAKAADALAAAQRFKEQELLSAMLYMEARDAEKEVARARQKMRDYSKKSVRAKLAGGYIEQIDALLEAYDFRQVSNKALARRASLADYVEAMRAAGREGELAIDERLLEDARRQHYSKMSLDEFRGLVDTVANIDHMGRFKNKLIEKGRQRDLDATVEEVLGAFEANVSGSPPPRGTATRGEKAKETFRDYLNWVLNADTLLREIDGFEDLGPAWRALKQGVDDGQSALVERRRKLAEDMISIFDVYSRKEQADMGRRRRIAALGMDMSKWDVIAMALNTGNVDNFERLTNPKAKGSFTPQQVEATLDEVMEPRDWAFVQSVWDYVDSYWPEIEAKERRLTGTAPKKVEAKAMVPRPGVTGGYYPIKYDARLSALADDNASKDLAESLMGGRFGKAQTANGHTKARANTSTQAVKLDIGVLFSHLQDVVYDLEMGEPVAASWRILTDGRVREAFLEKGKQSDWNALEVWLLDVASGERVAAKGLEVYLRYLRSGFVMSRLAVNISTAFIQPTGLTQSISVVGFKPILQGTLDYLSAPRRWRRDVLRVSPMMRERQATFERDVFNLVGDMESGPVTGRWAKVHRDVIVPASFWLMQKIQFYFVDMPTWVAAYQKEVARSKDEAQARRYADMAVKRAQGSGLMADRGMMERGTTKKTSRQQELPRLFTALASYMFAKFNVAYESGRRTDFKDPLDVLRFTADVVLLFTAEALLYNLVKGQWPDEDDDETVVEFAVKETALGMMGTLPLAREVSSALGGFGGGGVFGSSVELVARPIIQASQGDVDKALARSGIDAMGVLFHLPSGQANVLLDAMFDERLRPRDDTLPIEYFIRQPD